MTRKGAWTYQSKLFLHGRSFPAFNPSKIFQNCIFFTRFFLLLYFLRCFFMNRRMALSLSLSSSWLKLIESVLSYMMQNDWSKAQLLYTSIVYSWADRINSFLRYFITGKHRSVWKQYRDNRAWQRTFTFARLSSRRYTVGWRRKGRIGIRVPRTKRKGGRLERRKRSKSERAARIYMSFFTTPYSHAL